MGSVSQLPLPAGARVSAPPRRARAELWAAPDPLSLIIDPWAPPLGHPIADPSLSPWPAPLATARIGWLAAPPALLPPPVLDPGAAAAASTERALSTLRSLAAVPPPLAPPVALPAPTLATLRSSVAGESAPAAFPAPSPHTAAGDVDLDASRWRFIAIVGGLGAALTAGLTLVAALL